jgi:murein L,D-transpeptidase YafK
MMLRRAWLRMPLVGLLSGGGLAAGAEDRAARAAARCAPRLRPILAQLGLRLGSPLFMRVFKEESELEIWGLPDGAAAFVKIKAYPVARWSGRLGPKEKTGDLQAPEGFYHVDAGSLNPRSAYHLSFNINYPNAHDRALDRTGSLIMVHGSNVSIGCYAMTDVLIEEIYTLVAAALAEGQRRIEFHAFPFRMTEKRLARAGRRAAEKEWLPFWWELEPAYRIFEERRRPPRIEFDGGRQIVSAL